MNALESGFATLLGEQPNEQQKQDLYRTRAALNLKENDALWLLLIALGHYESLYRTFPTLISEAAAATLARVKEVADAQMKSSAETAKRELANGVVEAAGQVARSTAGSRLLKWATLCISGTAMAVALVGWWSYRQGVNAGQARGWVEAHRLAADERAAASWANTPEGRLAYGLALAGSIRQLATCSGRGWLRKGRKCFAMPKNGLVSGWQLPLEPSAPNSRPASHVNLEQ